MLNGATCLSIYLLYSLPALILSRGGGGGRGGRGGRRSALRSRPRFSSGNSYTAKSSKICSFSTSTPVLFNNDNYLPNEVSCYYGCCSIECCPWYSDMSTIVGIVFVVIFVTGTVIYVCIKSWQKRSETIYSKYQKRCSSVGTDLTTDIVTESSNDGGSYVNETFSKLDKDNLPSQKKQ